MRVILTENQNSELRSPEAGALEVKQPGLAPGEALKLVFGEYAANTQRAYARAFRDLQEWANIKELHEMESFDPLRMLEYKNQLKASGKKPSTINQTMSALRKVCRVLTEFGYLRQNPFKASVIRAEKVDSAASKGALQISQLNAMIEANEGMEYDGRIAPLLRFRNGLVLKFLYLTAARRGEAADLLWEDIVQDGSFHVAVLRHTKSRKEQRIKLRTELHAEFEEWRTMLQSNNIISPHVFPSLGFRTLGKKMCGKGINDIVATRKSHWFEHFCPLSSTHGNHTCTRTGRAVAESPVLRPSCFGQHHNSLFS